MSDEEIKRVWLKVKDTDEWVPCVCSPSGNGKTKLTRAYAPVGESRELMLPDDEVAKLRPAHGDLEAASSDLVWLSDVHECTMLHNLRLRYGRDHIYTAIGPVLLAINPYKKVSAKEGADASLSMEVEEPPHCNKTASAAYAGLLEGTPQSILISGESGAGKTETNKLCMACLADISNSKGVKTTELSLQAGILLEAFGNAKTVHNNNSSRFGKWCAVYFDGRGRMAATQIKSYLLEKSRVAGPTTGERNYHIFYQLLVGASDAQRKALKLGTAHSEYHYLKGEATAPGIDDKAEWEGTVSMLDALGFTADAQAQLYALYAGVLSLGNVEFVAADKADTFKVADKPSPGKAAGGKVLDAVADLLQVPATMLGAKLTTRGVQTASSSYTVPLTLEQCVDTRDALAKAIYVGLFESLIKRLNVTLGGDKIAEGDDRYIGLLDIFGFENFAINSFEQLCINLTNEKLQQHFMDALIKREQAEYVREGITCGHIEFPDNTKQIELIDHKKQGVLAMLDEECSVPKGSDASYVSKMHGAFKTNPHYSEPPRGKDRIGKDLGEAMSKLQFVIVHYAEPVQYTAHEWLEKNRGALHPDLASLMATSDSPGLQVIFTATPEELKAGKKTTVGAAFRASLRALSATMLMTTQHFIRCVKPNGVKKPDHFDGRFISRQLRYTGVHAVVDIHRAGYPIKYSFGDFVKRYRCMAFDQPQLIAESLPHEKVVANLLGVAHRAAAADPKSGESADEEWVKALRVQMGKTRVFMRADVVRHVEKPRHAARGRAAACVQRYARKRLRRRIARLWRKHRRAYRAIRAALDGEAELKELLKSQTTLESVPELESAGSQGSGKESEESAADVAAPALPQVSRDAASIQRRLDEGGTLLDALQGEWQAAQLNAAADVGFLGLPACHAELSELEMEIRETQSGLLQETKAAEVLRAAMATHTGATKEAFVALKSAVAAAGEASRGLTSDLEGAIAETEKALQSRFAAIIAEGNEEVKRILAARDEKRRAAQQEVEEHLLVAEDVVMKNIILKNGRSAKGKPLYGYTREDKEGAKVAGGNCGAIFDNGNTVSGLVRGGAAAEDNLLKVGDVVMEVDDERLMGKKVVARLDELNKDAVRLVVARKEIDFEKEPEKAMPSGDREGWMYLTKTKDHGETQLHAPKKCWAVLESDTLIFHEEVARGQERVPHPQPLKGAIIKVAMSKRSVKLNRAQTYDTQAVKLSKDDKKSLSKKDLAHYQKSKLVEQQKQTSASQLEQSAAVTEYLDRKLAPFKLTWPDGEQGVGYELVCAVTTSEERQEWTKAIQSKLDAINANAPTSGWLEKRKGRGPGIVRLTKVLGWDRRWFVLTQATNEGEPATLQYFERPGLKVAKGSVALNKDTTIIASEHMRKGSLFGFAVTSQGAADKKPITTVLCASKGAELDKWTGAIKRAIAADKAVQKLLKDHASWSPEEQELLRKTPDVLRQQLEYMGAPADRAVKDVAGLAKLIIEARKAGAAGPGTPRNGEENGDRNSKLAAQIKTEEEQLMKRSVEELQALLEYMEVDFDPDLEDKPKLVQLVIGAKNLSRVVKAQEPGLRKWRERQLSNTKLVRVESSFKNTSALNKERNTSHSSLDSAKL